VWSQNPKHDGTRKLSLGASMDIYVTVDSTRLPVDSVKLMEEAKLLLELEEVERMEDQTTVQEVEVN